MEYKGWLGSLGHGHVNRATLKLTRLQDQTIACVFHFCSPPRTFPSVSELAIKGRENIWVFCCNLLPALWICEEPGESQAGPERACASSNLHLSRDRTVLLPAAFPMLGWQKELSPYPRFCAARWPCRPLGRSTQHRFVLHLGGCSDSHLAEGAQHREARADPRAGSAHPLAALPVLPQSVPVEGGPTAADRSAQMLEAVSEERSAGAILRSWVWVCIAAVRQHPSSSSLPSTSSLGKDTVVV